MEQRTEEWLEARIGKITASRFKDLLTKGQKGEEFGKTALSYAYELVTQIITGVYKPDIKANALEWGVEWEPEARRAYQEATFAKVHTTGYIAYSDLVGGSPDGLIGEEGGIEIKCPYNSVNHLNTLISKQIPKDYIPQVQGYMMITKRKWWDYISFDPRFKPDNRTFITRIDRDEDYIKMLLGKIEKFKSIIENILKKVK